MQRATHAIDPHRKIENAMGIYGALQTLSIIGAAVASYPKRTHAGPLRFRGKRWNVGSYGARVCGQSVLFMAKRNVAFPAVLADLLAESESLLHKKGGRSRDGREAHNIVMRGFKKTCYVRAQEMIEGDLVVL